MKGEDLLLAVLEVLGTVAAILLFLLLILAAGALAA
jgi:hypothetical protein